MLKLYLLSISQMVKQKKLLLMFVIFSIASSMLCISLTLATAEAKYERNLNINYLTTIAIYFENDSKEQQNSSMIINKSFDKELLNVLYITKSDDNSTVIGWQGFNTQNWFPHVNGRFFTHDEVSNSEQIAYITDTEYKKILAQNNNKRTVVIDNMNYEVIGAGWIAPFNFKKPINNLSTQSIFVSDNSSDYVFRIIPYTTFEKNFVSELILIQFDKMSYTELEECLSILKKCFPSAMITMPEYNSDEYLLSEKIKRSFVGALLAVSICISTIGIMLEWLKINKKRYYVFVLCGASRKSLVFAIILEWLTYMIVGAVISTSIHYAALPWLTKLSIGYMPSFTDMLFFFAMFYLSAMCVAFKKIKKYTDVCQKE